VNGRGPGYALVVIPDDTAGRPLTPGELAAIADLEQRLLLETRAPVRNLDVARRGRAGRPGRRRSGSLPTALVPLLALLAGACVLIGVLAAVGVGLLGAASVLVSIIATALVWTMLPARFGGPVRPYRIRGRLPRHFR
jgi:hypothetical protein